MGNGLGGDGRGGGGKGFLEDRKRMNVVVRSVMLCKRGVPLAKWVGREERKKERKLMLK